MLLFFVLGWLCLGGILGFFMVRIKRQVAAMVRGCERLITELAKNALLSLQGKKLDQAILDAAARDIPKGFQFSYTILPTTEARYGHRFQIFQSGIDTQGNRTLLATVSERALLGMLATAGIDMKAVDWDGSERYGIHPAILFTLDEKEQRLFQQFCETRTDLA